jgi:hypothetical protein
MVGAVGALEVVGLAVGCGVAVQAVRATTARAKKPERFGSFMAITVRAPDGATLANDFDARARRAPGAPAGSCGRAPGVAAKLAASAAECPSTACGQIAATRSSTLSRVASSATRSLCVTALAVAMHTTRSIGRRVPRAT